MNITAKRRKIGSGSALLAGIAAMLVTVAGQAGQPGELYPAHRAVVVRYADLNLGTADGARALYARLSRAASEACGGEPSIRELGRLQAYQACVDHALDKAVKKVDSQRVLALHTERHASGSMG